MSPDDVQKEIEQLEQRFAENSKGLVFAHLADAYRKAGQYGKAEGLILHGLKNHPTYISAYNVLGRIYLDAERFPEAHEQFSKVLELDPHNLIALRALGDLAVRDGETEAAREWYERMLHVDPRNEEAQEELRKLEGGAAPSETAPPPPPPESPEAAALQGSEALDRLEAEPPPQLGTEPAVESDAGFEIQPEEEQPPGEPAEGEDLEIIGSPGLETSEHYEDRHPGGEEWDFAELDAEGHVDEDIEIERVEGLVSDEAAPSTPAGEPTTGDELGTGEERKRDDFDLDAMGDWTPGFISEEELSESEAGIQPVGDDFNFDLLAEEWAGPGELDEAETEHEVEGEVELPDELQDEGLVTETMAELYARQGFYQDALKIYQQLAEVRPNDERVRARIVELREQIDEDRSAVPDDDELAALLELTQSAPEQPTDETDSLADLDQAATAVEPAAGVDVPETPSDSIGDRGEPAEETPVAGSRPEEESTSPAAAAELTGAAESPAEAETAAGEGFEFEDEAPVAGLDHLDPFAASFEIFGRRDGIPSAAPPLLPKEEAEAEAAPLPEEQEAEIAGAAEAAVPAFEPSPEATDVETRDEVPAEAEYGAVSEEPQRAGVEEDAEAEEEPWALSDEEEAPVPVADLAGDDEEASVPVADLAGDEEEPVSAADLIAAEVEEDEAPEHVDAYVAAEAEPPAVDEAAGLEEPASASELVEEMPAAAGPIAGPEAEVTIEDYLAGLLAYEPGSRSSDGDDGGGAGAGEAESDESSDREQGEDLEEFQEWLRSLKR